MEGRGGLVSPRCFVTELMSSHRTPAPLSFPPHVIALGSLYTASLLLLEATQPAVFAQPNSQGASPERELVQMLESPGDWDRKYSASDGQIDGTLL